MTELDAQATPIDQPISGPIGTQAPEPETSVAEPSEPAPAPLAAGGPEAELEFATSIELSMRTGPRHIPFRRTIA